MATLVRNRRQALKVRLVLWVSILACGFALWGGWSIYETYGLSPGDGGVLRPLWERALFGAAVAGLGLAFAGGMLVFASLYVVGLAADRHLVEIDTMTLSGTRRHRHARSEIGSGTYHEGRSDMAAARAAGHAVPSVHAPWIGLRVRGRRLPYVIDMQSEEIDRGRLSRLAGGAAP